MRILLVEDDETLADGLSRSLAEDGFDLTVAATGTYADSALRTQDYDLVILDLGLPDIDGKEVLRQLRVRKSPVPVLILTARDGLDDRIGGLELGADDYMTKPFELRELEARVRALIRRSHGGFGHDIVCGPLVLNTFDRQVHVNGEPMLLPSREYGVLEALLLQAGRVVSKDRIALRLASGGDELADNAIEVYVHRLRRRLDDLGIRIRTVRGLGYLLERPAGE
ncbi:MULTISPECIES: response regulator [Methylococcus]|jgi:two-component system OmpR family response regulator|uniref:DNA-binding response regulator n=2 Tax=Methylococcus capsulatus TaxID=414 RepID=Q607J5_METCA|nr:response regulator [Methylococcus capsulatus]AAU92252.1 DNA-binding response regulator [Methylococcus capsulatus str. Bath]QXP87582.1 response regulator [Methylococcus capsulatus]QXP91062.1 response regulator [Methylococcus capsulatus]QXP92678.1 response regulator [Methylococcus capsulatus]UQN12597.1 response regulator [Methylococcus capsulatus]